MSMLYKIVNKAQLALSRLENVIDQEKGKIDSLIKSLSSGEMFFTLKYDRLELFTINPAALRYLDITEENPDIIHVLSKFRLKPNIIAEMKDVIGQKKSTIYRNVEVGTSRFNIYVTPVFSKSLDSVIGVALTMQDVTREHETQKMREGFTNMMVHELRAPLTAIKGAADLLLDPKTEEDDKVKMRLIVRNSSERLLGEIDEMLDTARIDAGKLLVHKSESDINEVIEKVVSELSYIAQNRSILIEKHLDTKIPHVFLDPLRIGQVVTNLISNSIKYSDEHTVIDVFSRIVGEFVEIEVKDHGIGIDQDLIKSLFQPFAQGNFFKKAKGTGLGLYITKDIVTEHGGQIRIESEVGKGTSMFVKLPLKQEVSHQAQPAPSRLN
jgi:signal transduction histidine kinase